MNNLCFGIFFLSITYPKANALCGSDWIRIELETDPDRLESSHAEEQSKNLNEVSIGGDPN